MLVARKHTALELDEAEPETKTGLQGEIPELAEAIS
jgi:hypothetical protein